MDLGLAGRVVLITGAGGGAGPTIARAFAAEGALVALHYRAHPDRVSPAETTAAEIVAAGGRAIAATADLGSTDEISSMIERVGGRARSGGRAGDRDLGLQERAIPRDQRRVLGRIVDDLLGATFRACRAVVPGMQAAGWGRIVNVAARSGLVGVARAAHYAAAKAGIVGLTASLAKELGPSGILVNCVAPTKILTVKDGVPSIPDERAAEMAKTIPVRRLATPDDLAALVLWLGSDANRYVTGETISLTGGDQR